MQNKIVTTADGSHSIFVPAFNENYHSVHGAIQESQHVFIDAALKEKSKENKDIYIFEMGFGTGLNAFMTYLEQKKQDNKIHIHYHTIEAFPISLAAAFQLNYVEKLEANSEKTAFEALHQANWSETTNISPYFHLTKYHNKIEEIDLPNNHFDIIYFDAFAPSSQAELWTVEIFIQMYNCLKINGILTTYCAKGVVKRTMKSVGFKLEALPGPIGKREMTRLRKVDLG
ncbi:MAG: tRNA (5-methylaminomethyl-2-thiouridine)(34)-methyltransferase MnmD [Chitinophagales bacterium]